METFGQVRIRLSEHRHLCQLWSWNPGPFLFPLVGGTKHGSRRKARQFCKVKHLREQHVRGRASSYIADVGGGMSEEGDFGRRRRSSPRAKNDSDVGGIYYCHDYGGSCLLLVKFYMLYAYCGTLAATVYTGCLWDAITYGRVFRWGDIWGCCRVACSRLR